MNWAQWEKRSVGLVPWAEVKSGVRWKGKQNAPAPSPCGAQDPVGKTDLSPVIPRIDQGWDAGAQGAEDAQRGLSPEKGNT